MIFTLWLLAYMWAKFELNTRSIHLIRLSRSKKWWYLKLLFKNQLQFLTWKENEFQIEWKVTEDSNLPKSETIELDRLRISGSRSPVAVWCSFNPSAILNKRNRSYGSSLRLCMRDWEEQTGLCKPINHQIWTQKKEEINHQKRILTNEKNTTP